MNAFLTLLIYIVFYGGVIAIIYFLIKKLMIFNNELRK